MRRPIALVLAGVVLITATVTATGTVTAQPGAGREQRVLIVRGGVGTAGFLHGGVDADLSDLFNERQTGFGRLGTVLALEGYEVTQVEEGPGGTKIDLDMVDLDRYGLVVLGSNNAAYTPADADRLADYVRAGGAALLLADANFGRDWRAAADSDQAFLDRFGLTISQDNEGCAGLTTSDFVAADHPVLRGVDEVGACGATAFTVTGGVPDAAATILARPNTPVRDNTGDGTAPGPNRPAGPDDAAIVVVEAGRGRVAGTVDRDTFFPAPLAAAGNRAFALQLVRWLTTGQ
jgi:hypothetical protein